MEQTKETEIARLAQKMKWSAVEKYRKYIKTEDSFEDNLLTLLKMEADTRGRELLKRRVKQAGFPKVKTLDTFEFNTTKLPYLKQDQVLELGLCNFIKEHTNVCAIGNSGTGKTHLAIALGMEAIRKGYSVRFCRACDLATQLAEAESEKRLNGMLKSLHKCQLLCLDELGYMTFDQRQAQLLFQVLAGRYEVRSTIITSNLEFSKWPTFMGDEVMAKALIGRLVQESAVLNMNGEGYRLSLSKK
jgi:DNA replication protein DnaC